MLVAEAEDDAPLSEEAEEAVKALEVFLDGLKGQVRFAARLGTMVASGDTPGALRAVAGQMTRFADTLEEEERAAEGPGETVSPGGHPVQNAAN
jgi:hypothetical protein